MEDLAVENVYFGSATDQTMDGRFSYLMKKPLKYVIVPIHLLGYNNFNPRTGVLYGSKKTKGIIRGQYFPDPGFKKYNNRQFGHRNNQTWNNNGGINKRKNNFKNRLNFNKKFNKNNRRGYNKGALPLKEKLDEELDKYMATSTKALDKDIDDYMKQSLVNPKMEVENAPMQVDAPSEAPAQITTTVDDDDW